MSYNFENQRNQPPNEEWRISHSTIKNAGTSWMVLLLICIAAKGGLPEMITNGSKVISSMGWVDHGSLWVLSVQTGKIDQIRFTDARSLKLLPGEDDNFLVQHTWGEEWDAIDRVALTAHSFSTPEVVSARIVLTTDSVTFEGDSTVWKTLPRAHVAPLNGHYYLFLIDAKEKRVERQALAWFERQHDTDYQSLRSVIEVPRSNFVLFPIQRNSRPTLYDVVAKKAVREIDLGAAQYKPGTPQLAFSIDGRILWALDYDTLLQLDRSNWKILNRLRLQEGDSKASLKFVGGLSFARRGEVCVVPRPFSSDVAIISTVKLNLMGYVAVGGQPLEAVLLDSGKIVARDWQTGQLLTGSFQLKE